MLNVAINALSGFNPEISKSWTFIQVCPLPDCCYIYKTARTPKNVETRMLSHFEEDHYLDFKSWPYYAQQYSDTEVNLIFIAPQHVWKKIFH